MKKVNSNSRETDYLFKLWTVGEKGDLQWEEELWDFLF